MKKVIFLILLFGILPLATNASNSLVSFNADEGIFSLSSNGISTIFYMDSSDYAGVIKVSELFRKDIERVTGSLPEVSFNVASKSKQIVIVGTIGKSLIIDKLIKDKKIDVTGIENKWETFLIEVVENPLPDVEKALVIAGSDKRGTIFGMFELSSLIGVSPWYWWADVPVVKHPDIFITQQKYSLGPPAVKYRGIFINDEAPALSGWTAEKFGGFNHLFYEKVFELILRMKGNYLWPAMWGRAFYDDDTLNPKIADEYGVVIGTSHHEPLMRAHDEWRRYGSGTWNYDKNPEKLREFWKEGIERMNGYESLITVGMRGDGDEPMSEESNIALLEKIVTDQRIIISDVTGEDPSKVPQVWALYKEVQDYYDRGMRVPDDITLLLCDDNWGNIRKLPKLGDTLRAGGYGIYYHFDYVGGPRNYKWLNTNPLPRIWEQMNLAYEYGARQLWIVNVGDIKPMEFPISFFLDYAWNPKQWPAEKIQDYSVQWASKQFGSEYAVEIADILNKYGKYNSLRKPELLSPETYSLINFNEFETIVDNYNALADTAEKISRLLPAEYFDAYYQLVLFPVQACANLNELYYTVAKNKQYAGQRRVVTNQLYKKAKELYARDAELTDFYNTKLADGKWSHMMDQTHIGYTYWQQPDKNSMPEVYEIKTPVKADAGVIAQGASSTLNLRLNGLSPFNKQSSYIVIFNKGLTAFNYTASVDKSWLKISPDKGEVKTEQRIWVSIDWNIAPTGKYEVPVNIKTSDGKDFVIICMINNPESPKLSDAKGFIETNGYISIEAEHYLKAITTKSISWQIIPDLGRTLSGVRAIPVTNSIHNPGGNTPHLEYKIYIFDTGQIKVNVHLAPTLDFPFKGGLKYAVSIDDQAPKIINMHSDYSNKNWENWVANNINISTSTHKIMTPGEHSLKFWLVDPGVVLEKIVIQTGEEIPESYLGPPESFYKY